MNIPVKWFWKGAFALVSLMNGTLQTFLSSLHLVKEEENSSQLKNTDNPPGFGLLVPVCPSPKSAGRC